MGFQTFCENLENPKNIMTRFFIFSFILFLLSYTVQGQEYRKPVRPVKNVIVMIPDGTSISVLTASRWLKSMDRPADGKLWLDPYLCGTVLTFCSNTPIGDSAPTTSCYMTGVPMRPGNVSIYAVADPENDLVPLNPEMAYQPLATVLEASRIRLGKSTGIVVTCEFPHATPADCAAHYYNRGSYKHLAPQMAYNNLDVVFGGGTSIVTDDMKGHFSDKGIKYIADDISAFRNLSKGEKAWALFEKTSLPYDLDRNPETIPSLAEMTRKALELLSHNENGFFLMVEGSQVDWGAHANDPAAIMTEFIAFDDAVGEAVKFAQSDGETAVIIMPDHGNSGFSIGNKGMKSSTKNGIFGNVKNYKHTLGYLSGILLKTEPGELKGTVLEYTGIEVSDEQLTSLVGSSDYELCDCNQIKRNNSKIESNLRKILYDNSPFGFTTTGHTGEEVFLAAYHPEGDIPVGMNTNIEINKYLCDVSGLDSPLNELTKEIYARHNEVFAGMKYSIDTSGDFPVLTVKKGKKTLIVPSFKSTAYLDGKQFDIGSVTIYIDKNETFYLPSSLREKIN